MRTLSEYLTNSFFTTSNITLVEAGGKYGGSTNIVNCCKGRTLTCKGYKWKFKHE